MNDSIPPTPAPTPAPTVATTAEAVVDSAALVAVESLPPAAPITVKPRRRRWKKTHCTLLVLLTIVLFAWITSAFYLLTVQVPRVGQVILGGGAITVWTLEQKTLQQNAKNYFVREGPWKLQWAWPIAQGYTVDAGSERFRNGESLGWHAPRKPEFFLRPYTSRSPSSWFIRFPLWLVVLPLTLLIAMLRFLHVRSPFIPICERCGYNLKGIAPDAKNKILCPECGKLNAGTFG